VRPIHRYLSLAQLLVRLGYGSRLRSRVRIGKCHGRSVGVLLVRTVAKSGSRSGRGGRNHLDGRPSLLVGRKLLWFGVGGQERFTEDVVLMLRPGNAATAWVSAPSHPNRGHTSIPVTHVTPANRLSAPFSLFQGLRSLPPPYCSPSWACHWPLAPTVKRLPPPSRSAAAPFPEFAQVCAR
jgi:hypothetical protein